MSDPIIEEDGLISQDDIDKLMESSSIEEAEDTFENDDDLADELGELSQDDIDSLMNSNLSGREDFPDKLDAADTEDGEMELISQDDIDQLMNSNSASEETLPALDDDEEFEELSQDDIKALMGARESKDEKEILPEELVGTGPEPEENDIFLDEKIEEFSAPPRQSRKDQDDFIINESEAVGVSDCLISQATLDGLIKNFNTVPDLVILDDDPPAPADSSPEPGAFKTPPDISDNDTEDFLKPGSDADILELKDDREDVTQEDIDALLSEPDDEEKAEDDVLISQDDIDTLLMAADQEDEDVLGDLMGKGGDIGLDDDILEKGASDETEEEDDDKEIEDEEAEDENEDQVVLQGEDEVAVKPKKKKKKAGTPWVKKKLVLAFASFLVILGITVPITYFFFFSDRQKVQEAQEVVSAKPVVNVQREVEIESSDAPLKPPVEDKNPGNMVLKDFVILAPDLSKNMTYVIADISIDYADQKVFQEIQNNLSYYRDLIYGAIGKSLVAGTQEDITEAEILSRIETLLKKEWPGNSISRVSFISFKIS